MNNNDDKKVISIIRYFLAEEILRNPDKFKILDGKLREARKENTNTKT